MTKTRLLPVMALALTLLLPGPAALAQDEPAETANDTIASDDPRLAELEALVPPALSGLPLRENLRLLTGEEALAAMSAEEAALVQAMLDENGKTTADYAAAATFVQTSATDVVILQAHRIEGLDAATAIDTWVQMRTRERRGLHQWSPGDTAERWRRPGRTAHPPLPDT